MMAQSSHAGKYDCLILFDDQEADDCQDTVSLSEITQGLLLYLLVQHFFIITIIVFL